MKESDLLNLRKIDSDLEGHPTPVRRELQAPLAVHSFSLSSMNRLALICILLCSQKLPFVDVATGSLGQGLSAACGMAYTGKMFDRAR